MTYFEGDFLNIYLHNNISQHLLRSNLSFKKKIQNEMF
jgi:hypothetical protein